MKVIIAQLSDWHIENPGDVILTREAEIAQAIASAHQQPDMIIISVTGDLTYSGTEAQYNLAKNLIDKIRLGIERRHPNVPIHLALIPGNHDCDFSSPQDVREILLDSLKKKEKALTPQIVSLIASPLEKFFNFRDSYASDGLIPVNELYWEYVFRRGEESIGLLCFNSAWTSKIHEQQGSLLYPEIVPRIVLPTLSISIMHHPTHWLRVDQSKEINKHIYSQTSIFLTGHEHVPDYSSRLNRQGELLKYIEGGALQDPNSPVSTFNVITVDTEVEKQCIYQFTWVQDMYRWIEEQTPALDDYQIKRFRRSLPFEINDVFRDTYLEDPGLHLTHRVVGKVKLSEIYVLPDFRLATLGEAAGQAIRGESFYDLLESQKNIIVMSFEQAGKTSLCKHLYMHFNKSGRIPIVMELRKGMRRVDDRFYTQLRSEIARQYSSSITDKYFQLDAAERVLIIDNFTTAHFSREEWVKCVEELHNFFGYLVFVSDDVFKQLEEIYRGDTISDGLTFRRIRMQHFGHIKRKELVEKWFSLGGPPDDEADFASSVVKVETVLSTLFGRGYAPSIPSYILPVLQTHESLADLEVSAASRAYLSRRLIDDALDKNVNSKDRATREGFLMHLANARFEGGTTDWDGTTFDLLWQDYKNKEGLTLQKETVLRELLNAGLLRKIGDVYSFNYPYVYYTYAALRFSLRVTSDETKAAVKRMVAEIYKEEFANILLFLSSLSQEDYIVEELLSVAKTVYENIAPARLESELSSLNGLMQELNQTKYLDGKEESARKKRLQEQDEIETAEDKVDETSGPLVELNRALKTLQILGQILRITVGSLGMTRKYEVTNACYELGLRTIAAVMDLVLGNKEEVLNSIYLMLRRQYGIQSTAQTVILTDQMIKHAKVVLVCLAHDICYGLVKRISYSIGTPDLELIFRQLRDAKKSTATTLIHCTIELEHIALRVNNLVESGKSIEDNPFALSILKSVVNDYIYLNRVGYREKDILCTQLQIERTAGTDAHPKLLPANEVGRNT